MSQNSVPESSHNRVANLRQRLLRASRFVNTAIVDGLHQRGFTKLSSTHTALLSNLDLEGSSLTIVAKRAGMSKQAMGRIADELISLKYVKSTRSEDDRRAIKLEFTQTGLKLMNHSFTIMEELENRCAHRLGDKHFKNLLSSLQDIVDDFENTSE
ncbi:MAG: winged helix-turn-helix transcriptional regulator [Ectothiorhodospiraceae bacterium]|nr:winged helix-turn-helix transcriptional regulator [Ectothiorhodospiraceae bacterium]MBN4053058.1 winged helix-turn-helix transcriptional regulator [Gammaproteobacteria bacterium AH-315-K14]